MKSENSFRLANSRRITFFLLALIGIIFIGILASLDERSLQLTFLGIINDRINTPLFSKENAYEMAKYQVELGSRIPGSESHRKTGEWIVKNLRKNGWEVEVQELPYKGVIVRNIIGKIGQGHPWIILGAHYDTRIEADQDPRVDHQTQPVPGANDGASGVAILLEMSRVIPILIQENSMPELRNGEIWLVFFDWEDNGRINSHEWIMGSRAFVETLESSPDVAVILDMVGDSDLTIYQERGSDPFFTTQIWETAEELGFASTFVSTHKYLILDDHVPFQEAGIPSVDIIDFDYPYWHTTSDTMDNISADSLEIVGKTVLEWLRQLLSIK